LDDDICGANNNTTNLGGSTEKQGLELNEDSYAEDEIFSDEYYQNPLEQISSPLK
jgi:hypothetical protein